MDRESHLMRARQGLAGLARTACLALGLTLGLAALHSAAAAAPAPLQVFACEPEWAALSRELAGEQARIYSATHALQDPHHIQARPSLIAAARQADLLVCTGAELEAGWLPLLLRQARNPRILEGQAGHFAATDTVGLLEVPARLDRADGDVHAAGNPHIQTDPRHIAQVAPRLTQRLVQLDPARAELYRARLADFSARWQQALNRWQQQAAPLKGLPVVVQHNGFPYMERWLGLNRVATLEPKPGIEPSSVHLSQVLRQLQQHPAKLVIRAAYHSGRSSDWLAERTGLPVVVLPFTVGGNEQAGDLFALYEDTLQRLLRASQP